MAADDVTSIATPVALSVGRAAPGMAGKARPDMEVDATRPLATRRMPGWLHPPEDGAPPS